MYRTDFWTLWEKARVGCFERTPSKHVYYYLGWNRSPAQTGYTRQVLRPGALGRPRGIGWRGRWEGGSGWATHVNPWLIHVNVWQKPLQYCRVISLQLIKVNEKKKKKDSLIQKYGKHFSPMLNKCSTFLMFSSGNHNLRGALWLNRIHPAVQQRWKKTPKLKHQETLEATRQI